MSPQGPKLQITNRVAGAAEVKTTTVFNTQCDHFIIATTAVEPAGVKFVHDLVQRKGQLSREA